MIKYSVLMSLYEKENPEYFKIAMKSVFNQTYKPDEIVLVEDGPLTSELYEVINHFKKDNPNVIATVRNETHIGLGCALNKGLLVCKNELVARMDTDDIAVSDRFEKQIAYFEKHSQITILGGQIEEFDERTGGIMGKRIVPETDTELKEYMKKRCPFNHMTVMFKKSDILAAGNYQDWFWNEDYFLWIRLALKGYIFANLPDILVRVRSGLQMYQRRGGDKYFQSEKRIQKYLLENGVISRTRYWVNISERFVLQRVLPLYLRGFVFRILARK